MQWYDLIPNKKNIEAPYLELCFAIWKLNRPDEALKQLKQYYQKGKKSNDETLWKTSEEIMVRIYYDEGEFDSVVQAEQDIVQNERNEDTLSYTQHELYVMGIIYKLLEDYPKALSCWRKVFVEQLGGFVVMRNQMAYAELFTLCNQPDSALYYYNLVDSAKAWPCDLRALLTSKGEYYLYLNQYQTALPYFLKTLVFQQQFNDKIEIKRTLLDIAKTYDALQKNDSAILYAKQGLAVAIEIKSKPAIRDGYEILYNAYSRMNKTDSAFKYYREYVDMKETVMNSQMKGKLAAYNYEHTIALLDKETVLQQQQLKQEKTNRNILIASLIIGLLLAAFVIRNIQLKRKKDQLQHLMTEAKKEQQLTEIQQQKTELEMQALRAQMNPHFIFNCLNSINRFIQTNKTTDASDYLAKFAKLIRIVLQQSGKSFIPLEDELYCLQLYMDLEALRFEKPFIYQINCNRTDVSSILVPPLLLQPFVENAIWHGLHPMQNVCGKISIGMHLKNDMLHCTICDNGIGRTRSSALKKDMDKKSLGIQLTHHRLQLIDTLNKDEAGVEFNDLTDEAGHGTGTCVQVKIPVQII
jgi:tetratricopeptide (TPR) repeat protein